jgi:hypothetical protein
MSGVFAWWQFSAFCPAWNSPSSDAAAALKLVQADAAFRGRAVRGMRLVEPGRNVRIDVLLDLGVGRLGRKLKKNDRKMTARREMAIQANVVKWM